MHDLGTMLKLHALKSLKDTMRGRMKDKLKEHLKPKEVSVESVTIEPKAKGEAPEMPEAPKPGMPGADLDEDSKNKLLGLYGNLK